MDDWNDQAYLVAKADYDERLKQLVGTFPLTWEQAEALQNALEDVFNDDTIHIPLDERAQVMYGGGI